MNSLARTAIGKPVPGPIDRHHQSLGGNKILEHGRGAAPAEKARVGRADPSTGTQLTCSPAQAALSKDRER